MKGLITLRSGYLVRLSANKRGRSCSSALTLAVFGVAMSGAPPALAGHLPLNCLNSPGVALLDPGNKKLGQVVYVCVDNHTPPDVTVVTLAKLAIEFGNSGSHELGHSFGLDHPDGTTGDHIMDVSFPFAGLGRFFSDVSIKKLNAKVANNTVIFLDFLGNHDSNRMFPFYNSPVVQGFFGGVPTAESIGLIQNGITAFIVDDFYPLVPNFQITFTQPQAGTTYETAVFFSQVPVPGAALLGAMGLGMVGWVKRRFA